MNIDFEKLDKPQLVAAVRGVLALADALDADDVSYSYATHRIRTAVAALGAEVAGR